MYAKYLKRIMGFTLSLCALIVLFPLFIILTILGFFLMSGNPFFTQERPGKNERVFKLIKFRSMDNSKDKNGNLLPDSVRLNKYGRFLRATSLDELPELINIIKGDMAIVGPRPLRTYYLPWYTEEERHRHDVRPGLTGLAQVKGRNNVDWDRRLQFDIEYVSNISFTLDLKILFLTLICVLKRSGVQVDSANEGRLDEIRKTKMNTHDKE